MKTLRELMDMQDRVAIVTGGAGRLGLAFCECLAELGASVFVFDIAGERAMERANDLRARFGIEADGVAVDITSETQVETAVGLVLGRKGRLDVLVNNAAYAPTDLPPDGFDVAQQSLAQWEAQTNVMLKGTFLVTRACNKVLQESRRGAVINIASIYGMVGPMPGLYDGTTMCNPAYYAAAKGGIVQLTRYFATMFAPDVRVNCIAPGGIRTDQPATFQERYNARTPLGRMADPEDVKGALAYLASDLSAYVTGQVLAVEGGWTAW